MYLKKGHIKLRVGAINNINRCLSPDDQFADNLKMAKKVFLERKLHGQTLLYNVNELRLYLSRVTTCNVYINTCNS